MVLDIQPGIIQKMANEPGFTTDLVNLAGDLRVQAFPKPGIPMPAHLSGSHHATLYREQTATMTHSH
jgi:hypothetical protein